MDLTFATYSGDSICGSPKDRFDECLSNTTFKVVDVHESIVALEGGR